jgi:hypothetical protein
VYPGISVTIARSCSSSRLNKLLLRHWTTDNGQRKPGVHQLAVGETFGELGEPERIGASRPQNLRVRRDAHVVFGEVYPASSSEISSSSDSLSGARRRETEPSTCWAAMRAWKQSRRLDQVANLLLLGADRSVR